MTEHHANLTVDGRGWSCSCGRMSLGYADLDEAVRAAMYHERTAPTPNGMSLRQLLTWAALAVVVAFGGSLGVAMLVDRNGDVVNLALLIATIGVAIATLVAMSLAIRGEERQRTQRRQELIDERERKSRG